MKECVMTECVQIYVDKMVQQVMVTDAVWRWIWLFDIGQWRRLLFIPFILFQSISSNVFLAIVVRHRAGG